MIIPLCVQKEPQEEAHQHQSHYYYYYYYFESGAPVPGGFENLACVLSSLYAPLPVPCVLRRPPSTKTHVWCMIRVGSASNGTSVHMETVSAHSCRCSPLLSCSRGPTRSWRGPRSGVCGPTHLNSGRGRAGLPAPRLNTPG